MFILWEENMKDEKWFIILQGRLSYDGVKMLRSGNPMVVISTIYFTEFLFLKYSFFFFFCFVAMFCCVCCVKMLSTFLFASLFFLINIIRYKTIFFIKINTQKYFKNFMCVNYVMIKKEISNKLTLTHKKFKMSEKTYPMVFRLFIEIMDIVQPELQFN